MDRLVGEYGVKPKSVLHVGAHLAEEAGAYHAAGVERVLWVEANEGCALLPQVDEFLAERGFERVALQDAGYYHGWADALYVRRDGDRA